VAGSGQKKMEKLRGSPFLLHRRQWELMMMMMFSSAAQYKLYNLHFNGQYQWKHN
jgi:hypothetical protein